MTGSELIRILKKRGCSLVRKGKGSHQLWQCGKCRTIIAMHPGDIPTGTLRKIERDLAPCLGDDWIRKKS